MKDFVLPFKPEELLAKPAAESRIWAGDLPDVEEWSPEETASQLDSLIGRVLASNGHVITEDETFSLLFALINAWPRLDEAVRPRIVDILADAARRLVEDTAQTKKAAVAPGQAKNKKEQKEEQKQLDTAREARTSACVAAFFLRWCTERMLRDAASDGKIGRTRSRNAKKQASAEEEDEAKETLRILFKQRCTLLSEMLDLLSKPQMAWLWLSDDAAWQQVAQCVSDAGFYVLDVEGAIKHKELRQLALRCVAEPLLQEGHQHENLLVATVSKMTHSLRGHELSAAFASDALLLAHSTPLPRSFLIELTQHCTPGELQSQGAFQRALGSFLTGIAEKLPHVALANISVLLPLLDVDCYPLRTAICESIGHLLQAEGKPLPKGARRKDGEEAAAEAEGEGETAKSNVQTGSRFAIAAQTKKELLETLAARATDKTVWVRVKALSTLNNLASNRRVAALPRDQWTRVLEIAIRRMQDVASSARKAAIQLVCTLIKHHPYGPAIKGSGDERVKADHVLREVHQRLRQLREEELKAEAEAAGVDIDVDAGEEEEAAEGATQEEEASEAKRRRCMKKTATEVTAANEVDQCMEEGAEGHDAVNEQRAAKVESLKRMQDCYTQRVRFVELIDAAEARLRALLVSRTASDVTEAINVVVELRLQGLPAAMQAFNHVLGLVWSRTESVKDAAVDAFHRMHLDGRDTKAAVRALLEMYMHGCQGDGNWTYTHLASVQEIIQQAASKELLDPKKAIPALVDALEDQAMCSSALRALTALTAANSAVLAAQVPRIIENMGRAPVSTSADRLGRSQLICQLLMRLQACSPTALSDDTQQRMLTLSEHSTVCVVDHFVRDDMPAEWFSAAQAAMDLAFDLHLPATSSKGGRALRCPDKMWEQILSRMLQLALGRTDNAQFQLAALADGAKSEALVAVAEGQEAPVGEATDKAVSLHTVTCPQLAGIVFLSGHLALRMLVFLEELQSALKKRRLSEEDARMAEARDKKKEQAAQQKEIKKKGKRGSKAKEEDEEDEADAGASMGMAGQEEREAELFAEIAEQRLLYGSKSLLDRVKPLILACLLNPSLSVEPILRRLAAISLCKFMTVSKKFCEENLQLLFSVLFPKAAGKGLLAANSGEDLDMTFGTDKMGALKDDLTLRQSLLVAVGDLLFRHPNVVEPWSDRLFAALGGGSGDAAGTTELRLTALLVLTHLVLNDMMKPRAVLLVRALWLTACPHEATARVARILFQELSKRTTNIVYNLLPQTVALVPEHKGSVGGDVGSSEDRVRYLVQFIEKEKHVEGLIEKLSVRLEQSADAAGGKALESKQQDIADDDIEEAPSQNTARAKEMVSCLATGLGSMNYTDRCILRLHDLVVVRKALNNALAYNQVVRDNVMSVIERARKPKGGKEKGADAPPPEAEAAPAGGEPSGPGGRGAAVAAALDALEQTVQKLGEGKAKEKAAPGAAAPVDEAAADAAAPAAEAAADAEGPAATAAAGRGAGRGKGGGRGNKRGAKPAEQENAEEDEAKPSKGRGKGRRTANVEAEDKENSTAANLAQPEVAEDKNRGVGGAAAKRRRKASAVDDDADDA